MLLWQLKLLSTNSRKMMQMYINKQNMKLWSSISTCYIPQIMTGHAQYMNCGSSTAILLDDFKTS